jgi:hypothetical protein
MEWCKPVPVDEAVALASQYPELSLRTEPAPRSFCINIGGRWR